MKTKVGQQVTSVKLVDGLYTAEEAREVVLGLLHSKIHFHELNNFRSVEQTGKPDPMAQHRLPELISEQEKARQLLQLAADKRCILNITASIQIELIDEGR